MSTSTEWLVRLVCVVMMLWFGWQLTSQTVVTILQQSAQIQQLQRQLEAQKPPAPAR